MDERLRSLEVRVRADPGDARARAELRRALCRLADLEDAARWSAADPDAQDLVLSVVGRVLGPAFEPGPARTFACPGAPAQRIGSFRLRDPDLLLHLVPGGRCHVGSERGTSNEVPRHVVRVPPLLLGRFPVRQAEWDHVGGEDRRRWRGPTLPIEGVSWHDAKAWLARAGHGLRLPSEAEWEYACRAGSSAEFFWGDQPDPAYAWYGEGDGWRTHAPEEHASAPNAFGLVDMAGNVFEWCEDAWLPYEAGERDAAPRGAARAGSRVLRGGDAFGAPSHCRSAYRSVSYATDRGHGVGFRVARSLDL